MDQFLKFCSCQELLNSFEIRHCYLVARLVSSTEIRGVVQLLTCQTCAWTSFQKLKDSHPLMRVLRME
jgi:hypothetical protein